jgi:hypothetical protein
MLASCTRASALLVFVLLPLSCKREKPVPVAAARSTTSQLQTVATDAGTTTPAPTRNVPSAYQKVRLDALTNLKALPDLDGDLPREFENGVRPHRSQLAFSQYSGGASYFCGIVRGRSHRCFDLAGHELGIGQFIATAVGDDFSCALDGAGAVRCAPANRDPRAVSAKAKSAESIASPATADAGIDGGAPAVRFKALAAQGGELCLLDRENQATCASQKPSCDLDPPKVQFKQLTVGKGCLACGIDMADKVHCWGASAPKIVPEDAFEQIAAGSGFVCAISKSNALACTDGAATSTEKVQSVQARGKRVCFQESSGRIRCNQGPTPEDDWHPVTWAITEKELCYEMEREAGAIYCSNEKDVTIPENPLQGIHPTWAATPAQHERLVTARKRLLTELLQPMPEVNLPLELDERLEFSIGPSVESRYLPLLENWALDCPEVFAPKQADAARRNYRYGFRIQLPEGRHSAVVVRKTGEEALLTWYVFNEDAEVASKTNVMYRGHFALPFDEGCTRGFRTINNGEEVTRSHIDERGSINSTSVRTQEQAEYDPINKHWVYVCVRYESTLSATLGAKGHAAKQTGFIEKHKHIGQQDCEAQWPIGRPSWVHRVEPTAPAPATCAGG